MYFLILLPSLFTVNLVSVYYRRFCSWLLGFQLQVNKKKETKVTELSFVFFRTQDGICDKNSAPSVSSISRLLRGGRRDESDPRKNHSIDGILGE